MTGIRGSTAASPKESTTEYGSEVVGDGRVRARFPDTLRRSRGWIALALALLTVLAFSALTAGAGGQDPLSPDNPAPPGARAVAEVLRSSGVEVVRAESLEGAVDALQGPGDTLLLHDPHGWLTSEQLATLGGGLADRRVLVEPGLPALTELAAGIRSAGVVPAERSEPLQAHCSNSDARAAGTTTSGGFSYRGPDVCFPVAGSGDANPAGTFVTTADGTTAVLGNGSVLSNEAIDDSGNAALALRVLGKTPTLVWYQPTEADLSVTSGAADPLSLLPGFVNPLMNWLLITALLAIFWRGRRLGPLVTEPLPVVVRSAETAAGRARLYQDAGAVEHAAETLRAATLVRLATALRTPRSSPRAAVVASVARKTTRDYADLDRLLNSFTPRTEAQLVQWSQELQKLEQEIRNS